MEVGFFSAFASSRPRPQIPPPLQTGRSARLHRWRVAPLSCPYVPFVYELILILYFLYQITFECILHL